MDYREEYRIADLIGKRLMGVITPDEETELDEWCRREGHSELYIRIADKQALAARTRYTDRLDVDKAWQRVWKQLPVSSVRTLPFAIWYKIAVCVVLLVGLGMFLFYSRDRKDIREELLVQSVVPGSSKAVLITAEGKQIILQDSSVRAIQVDEAVSVNNTGSAVEYRMKAPEQVADVEMNYNTIVVPRGGEYELRLADGTKVWLNSDSELRFPVRFTGENRQVVLKGEAFFMVAKDSLRPFIVDACDRMKVEVLGTEFNVQAYPGDNELKATLNRGKVRIALDEEKLVLYPDQQAVCHMLGNTIEMRHVKAEHYSAWKDGKFIFEDERLENILNRLARWYNISFFYQSNVLKDFHFTGDLEKYNDFSVALRMLEKSTNIRFQVTGESVVVQEII